MYKKTQESTDHLERVGSAATRPSARGIIRDIPTWAKEPEEYFNSTLESYNVANRQLFRLRCRHSWLKFRIDTFQATPGELLEEKELKPVIRQMEHDLDGLRTVATLAAKNAYSTVFYFMARQLIDDTLFSSIADKTGEILGRQRGVHLPQMKPTKHDTKLAKRDRFPQEVPQETIKISDRAERKHAIAMEMSRQMSRRKREK